MIWCTCMEKPENNVINNCKKYNPNKLQSNEKKIVTFMENGWDYRKGGVIYSITQNRVWEVLINISLNNS